MSPSDALAVRLPQAPAQPYSVLVRRLVLSLALIVAVALVAYLGRDGYKDAGAGDGVSLLDAFYYATVSVTTTGYGDITPVSDSARLINTLVVTPMRVIFLILLVGTTVEILAERSRAVLRLARWRRELQDHIIICGFGTKGRAALETLLSRGQEPVGVVVVDTDQRAVDEAVARGLAGLCASAERTAVLEEAGIRDARAVVVAPDRDDSAVLITLTARELNATATIVASVREEENVHLLRQSGANFVLTAAGTAGRMLGLATETPRLVEVLEDLLEVGHGLDLIEREVRPDEVGPLSGLRETGPVVAVLRGSERLRFDDPRAAELQTGDRVVCLCSNPDRASRRGAAPPAGVDGARRATPQ